MIYDKHIFGLYEQLFQDAHASLEKEAAGVPGAPGWISEGLSYLTPKSVIRAGMARHAPEMVAERAAMMADLEAAKRIQEQTLEATTSLGEARAASAAGQAAHQAHLENQLKQFHANPNALSEAQQSGNTARNLALGAGGIAAAGIPGAYYLGKNKEQERGKMIRNVAFGAGAASGLAAPQIVRGLGALAGGASQLGLFPELEGVTSGMNNPAGAF